MTRKPSLHILHSDLKDCLLGLDFTAEESKLIFNSIISYGLLNPLKRAIIVTNKRVNKKLLSTISNEVEKFNLALNAFRSNLNHKNIKVISKTDRQYTVLCSIANNAERFCKEYELDLMEGFNIYIGIGMKKIGRNYSLNKFITYGDYIFDNYGRVLAVKNDNDIELTVELASYYIKMSKITNEAQVKEIWTIYAHDFVYCREQLTEMKADYRSWIDAQFKGLKYLGIIPEPYQLHGEEAHKRYITKGKITEINWRDEARRKMKHNS